MAKAKTTRTVVAILLVIEAAALSYAGLTPSIPHVALLIMVIGLLAPRMNRVPRIATAVVAIGYAILFVFPGSVWMLFGSCGGIMNSTCSNGEFLGGVMAFAVSVILNFVAAFMLAGATKIGEHPAPPPP